MGNRKKKVVTDLLITGIADKGRAVGRGEDGQVVFVDGAVPGDIVDVVILRKRSTYLEGVVIHQKFYSEERIEPTCRHFGVCGGCKWQHLSYQNQLKYKHQVVKDSMSRIAKLNSDIVLPIFPCETEFFYRNKLEYSFSSRRWITHEEAATDVDVHKNPALGFHRPGYHEKIVDITECLLQDSKSDDVRNFIKAYTLENDYSYYDVKEHKGLMRNIVVRDSTLGEWMVIVVFGYNDKEKINALMEVVAHNFPFITALMYIVNTKVNDTLYDQNVVVYKGQDFISEKLGKITYRIGPKSFFQTNPKQAVNLFNITAQFADFKKEDNVYDLYTGLGSIALFIADQVKQVVGIEEISAAIDDAKLNASLNKIENAIFYAGDVKDILSTEFAEKHGKPDVVITDPPRAGMHAEVIETLLKLEAPRIVYVSCNPATQARDLSLLGEKYHVVAVQPVDMFPHTHHIESVAKLELKVKNE